MSVKILKAPVKVLSRKAIPLVKPSLGPLKKGVKYQELTLPTEAKAPDLNLNHYTMLIYGREKIGKTTVLSSFPGAIFFSTEPGTKGLSIFEFNSEDGGVKNWDIFCRGVELLKENPGQFQTVVIDTIDRAYDMCLDWVCEHKHIEYPGQDSSGAEDFGKSWRAVKMEFLEQIHELSQAGYGIVFTSHAKEETIKDKATGSQYTRIFPTMSKQARTVIEAIVDLFFYAEYMRARNGTTKRVLICRGDETIWAGARTTCTTDFPQFLPLEKDGWGIINSAFLGEYQGLTAAEVGISTATTKTAKQFIQKEKVKEAKGTR